jgi:putative addiction module CopG family antidote
MSISLNPETQKLVEQRMKQQGYSTADDLVRAGLESLRQQQERQEFAPGELDELLAEGERSGPPLDGEQVLAELREFRLRNSSKAG